MYIYNIYIYNYHISRYVVSDHMHVAEIRSVVLNNTNITKIKQFTGTVCSILHVARTALTGESTIGIGTVFPRRTPGTST